MKLKGNKIQNKNLYHEDVKKTILKTKIVKKILFSIERKVSEYKKTSLYLKTNIYLHKSPQNLFHLKFDDINHCKILVTYHVMKVERKNA